MMFRSGRASMAQIPHCGPDVVDGLDTIYLHLVANTSEGMLHTNSDVLVVSWCGIICLSKSSTGQVMPWSRL